MRSWNYKLLCGAVCLAQLACLSLPVWAAENTGPITAQTTMQEIRQDPSIAKSGIFTFGNADDGSALLRAYFQNQTLAEYAGQEQAEDCAAALNLVVENYNAGRQVTYKVYTEEEIAAMPAKAAVELYYFPAEQANAKFAVVLGGNVAFTSGELREGMASAAQLHDMGYGVFVLRYRIWMDMGDNAPLEDLARAVEYITAHAEELGVQPEDYALVGFPPADRLQGCLPTASEAMVGIMWQTRRVAAGVFRLRHLRDEAGILHPVRYRHLWVALLLDLSGQGCGRRISAGVLLARKRRQYAGPCLGARPV